MNAFLFITIYITACTILADLIYVKPFLSDVADVLDEERVPLAYRQLLVGISTLIRALFRPIIFVIDLIGIVKKPGSR